MIYDHWLDVAVDCYQITPEFAAKVAIEMGRMSETTRQQQKRIEELEAKLAAKECPLDEECDLTGAYMAGAEKAKETIRQLQSEIDRLKENPWQTHTS